MSDNIPVRCLERGEGYAVWEAEIPREPTIGMATEEASIDNPATYNTVTLYRPVDIEVHEDYAEARYPADYAHSKTGWRYVPARYVRTSPPRNAEPAYLFGVNGPEEPIAVEDVPKDYNDE